MQKFARANQMKLAVQVFCTDKWAHIKKKSVVPAVLNIYKKKKQKHFYIVHTHKHSSR